jgi:hypothetical protein
MYRVAVASTEEAALESLIKIRFEGVRVASDKAASQIGTKVGYF